MSEMIEIKTYLYTKEDIEKWEKIKKSFNFDKISFILREMIRQYPLPEITS